MSELLVIGNGFDLQLGLDSSFDNFFESPIFQKYTHLNSFYGVKNLDNVKELLNYFNYFRKNSIPELIGLPFKFDETSRDSQYMNMVINTNEDILSNFWVAYFKILKNFPDYHDKYDEFNYEESSNKKELRLWSNIEYQINYLLSNTEGTFKKYDELLYIDDKYRAGHGLPKNSNVIIDDFRNSYFSVSGDNNITFIGVLKLLTINLSLLCGWKPRKEDIYSFLFKELKIFENIFNEYLQDTLNKKNDYQSEANKFAHELVDNDDYSLINFNYTSFYNFDNPYRVNIHSTLSKYNNGHPIFGITSYSNDNLNEESLISDKAYYRFTKVYRIMSQAQKNIKKRILPTNSNKIVFYGHSFAQADYSYFDAIFDHYHIYDDSSNIQLVFKFSNYVDKKTGKEVNVEQHQISAVYKLINQFAQRVNRPNLLQKLLLENRILFKRVIRG